MLILPPGHAESLRQRRRLNVRERWVLGSVAAAVLAGVIAVVIALGSGAPTSRNGCIHVTSAYTTGAQEIDRCGAQARALCGSLGSAGGYGGPGVADIARECRKAGLRVGS